MIDLRPSTPTQTHGFFVSDHEITDSDYEPFGDASGTRLEGLTMSPAQRATWASMLGITESPVAGSLLDLLWNTLTVYSDPDGASHAKPLMPTAGGVLELHLGGHSLVRSARIPLDVTTTPHWGKMQRVLQASYRDVEMQSRSGKNLKARQLHQRWLGAMRDKCGLTDDQATGLLVPADLPRVKPIKPETTITESFNKADSDTLGPDLSWTEITGDMDIVSNRVQAQTADSLFAGRADSDLSSTDHYSQAVCQYTGVQYASPGVMFRKDGTSTATYYIARIVQATDTVLYKVVSGTVTTLGTNHSAHTASTNYTVKGTANGTTISFDRDAGTETESVTDSSIASGVRCGIGGYEFATQTAYWDTFEAADLAAGTTNARLVNKGLVGSGLVGRGRLVG